MAEDRERAGIRVAGGIKVIGIRRVQVDVHGVRGPEMVDSIELQVGPRKIGVLRERHRTLDTTLTMDLDGHLAASSSSGAECQSPFARTHSRAAERRARLVPSSRRE